MEEPGSEVQDPPTVGVRELEFDDPVPTVPVDFGDNRQPVTSPEELQSYPLRTVVQIELEIPAGFTKSLRTGTGFLVGPRHVLTNHHVVVDNNEADINPMIDMDPPGFSFQVYPGRLRDADLNGGGLECRERRLGSKRLGRFILDWR